jgi:hypothetical protein
VFHCVEICILGEKSPTQGRLRTSVKPSSPLFHFLGELDLALRTRVLTKRVIVGNEVIDLCIIEACILLTQPSFGEADPGGLGRAPRNHLYTS